MERKPQPDGRESILIDVPLTPEWREKLSDAHSKLMLKMRKLSADFADTARQFEREMNNLRSDLEGVVQPLCSASMLDQIQVIVAYDTKARTKTYYHLSDPEKKNPIRTVPMEAKDWELPLL